MWLSPFSYGFATLIPARSARANEPPAMQAERPLRYEHALPITLSDCIPLRYLRRLAITE